METGLKMAVLATDPAFSTVATKTANTLAIPLAKSFNAEYELFLVYSGKGLFLQLSEPGSGPVSIDFSAGANAHRRKFGGGNKQSLARATGLNKWESPKIVDATGGLVRDAFVMASLGAHVTIMERSPALCLLIETALASNHPDSETRAICERMTLSCGNSIDLLQQMNTDQQPDVIYLDPMYPHRQKSASVKKDMQLLHKLVGQNTDSIELLKVAMKKAEKRVVVKRPAKAEPLSEHRLTGTVKSTNTRYDIYAPLD